jgi:hypothetical protein
MHEYDVALNRILTRPGSVLLAALTGSSSLRWLNVEAPLVRNLRVDLLGESPDGELVHIELQSRNEKDFPMRMGEYSFGVALRHGRLPRQVALYVGAEPLRRRGGPQGLGRVGGFAWCAGENRRRVVNERVIQERSSELS